MAKSIGERSEQTMILAERLSRLEVGETVTYSQMNNMIRKDVQRAGRYHLESARKIILAEKNIVTDCVKEVGIKRLDGPAAIGKQGLRVQRISRSARRGKHELVAVDWTVLDANGKLAWSGRAAQLHVIAQTGGTASYRKLISAAHSEQKQIPGLEESLDALKRLNGRRES